MKQKITDILTVAGFVSVWGCIATAPLWWHESSADVLCGTVMCFITLAGCGMVRLVMRHFIKARKRRPIVRYISKPCNDRDRRCLGYITPEMICESARRERKVRR